MNHVQQIADLEARVLRVIDLIERLRTENRTLTAELESTEQRSREQGKVLANLHSDQQNVEEIIVRTLNKLDGLEDAWEEMKQEDQPAAEQPDSPAPPSDPPPGPPGSGVGQSSLGAGIP